VNDLISVIILTYNRFSLLSKTLHSVLKQTHNDFEIIIINDGSTDETGDLLDVFKDERIRLYNLKKQNNLAKLRNYGVQMSKGEFISFCDDDDLWETDKLEIQMTYLQNHDFICTNVKLIDINDIILDTHYIKFKKSFILKTQDLLKENLVIPSSVIFRKKILKNDKPFDETRYINLCEDYNLWIKLSLENDLFFLNESLALHRTHDSWARNYKHSREIFANHINLSKPFLRSDNKDLKDTAYLSILNNRYYSLKYILKKKKYITFLSDLAVFIFMFKNPMYIKALIKKFKNYFSKNDID